MSAPDVSSRPVGRSGFAARLLTGQGLVLVAMALTTWLVSSAVGPSIFRDHLHQAGVAHHGPETEHVEEAFWSALLISLGLSLLVAVLVAFAVAVYLSRRVQRSIGAVTTAAAEVGAGHYSARVTDPRLGGEFATLSTTINSLAERLQSVEDTRRRMLSDLAHEMRTPLATIDAHLEAVEDGVRSLDADTLGIIVASTGRLRRLAEDIGAVSRAEEAGPSIAMTDLDARDLVRTAATVAADRYRTKGVRLELALGSEPASVHADPDRLAQVLGNLLDNALRHTPATGTVTVACQRSRDRVELTVTDTGDGIAPEHLGHVFDRFYRVDTARDRKQGGSGIGLAITKALVEAHGGTLAVASAGPGQGSSFTVLLPSAT